jgi:hypothetical protein
MLLAATLGDASLWKQDQSDLQLSTTWEPPIAGGTLKTKDRVRLSFLIIARKQG